MSELTIWPQTALTNRHKPPRPGSPSPNSNRYAERLEIAVSPSSSITSTFLIDTKSGGIRRSHQIGIGERRPSLIDSAPIRNDPNPLRPNANLISNRRKTGIFRTRFRNSLAARKAQFPNREDSIRNAANSSSINKTGNPNREKPGGFRT